jgi:hypothetical protein
MEKKTHQSDMIECTNKNMIINRPDVRRENANPDQIKPVKVSWQDKLTNGDPPELMLWGSDVSVGGAV